MSDTSGAEPRERRQGDRRSGDRRRNRSRGGGWRAASRPAGYGALSVILLILLVRMVTGDEESTTAETVGPVLANAEPQVSAVALDAPATATREAFSAAEYEGLLAEGDAAVGAVVRTELFCGPLTQVTVRMDAAMHPTIREMTDAEGRVAATDCRWSRESLSSDLSLVVPPDLAEDFATAPTVEISFVTRRRIRGDVEWLGRSPELALRTAGILRRIAP